MPDHGPIFQGAALFDNCFVCDYASGNIGRFSYGDIIKEIRGKNLCVIFNYTIRAYYTVRPDKYAVAYFGIFPYNYWPY